MLFIRRSAALGLVLLFSRSVLALSGEPIASWTAPPFWMPGKGDLAKSAAPDGPELSPEAEQGVPTPALAFTGITPCRIADTRGNGFTGAYGPPSLTQGSPRNFTLTGQCGIPGAAQAVSLNITVTNAQGPGFILIYPQGGAQPGVSTLNYVAGDTIANAAVVPLGTGGGVTVIAGVSGTDLIIDTNGFYAPQTVVNTVNGLSGTVTLAEGGDISITPVGNSLSLSVDATPLNTSSAIVRRDGSGNFAAGSLSLSGNLVLPTTSPTAGSIVQDGTRLLHTFGFENVFLGPDAGNVTMTGFGANTGIGFLALNSNTTGDGNTAIGTSALRFNTTGHLNTAGGQGALQANIGGNMNTAYGWVALLQHTNGDGNSAIGVSALEHSTGGSNNTAIGYNALLSNSTGSGNTAVGFNAGSNLTTGGNNIDIGHAGVADEANTIRIGTGGTNTRAFLAGVRGVTTGAADALTVMIDSNGQLGTISSSASLKHEISDVGDATASQASPRLFPLPQRHRGNPAVRPDRRGSGRGDAGTGAVLTRRQSGDDPISLPRPPALERASETGVADRKAGKGDRGTSCARRGAQCAIGSSVLREPVKSRASRKGVSRSAKSGR
jgi:hypothetical protein